MDKSAPSKESLERARRFFRDCMIANCPSCGRLALEFEAIARERDEVTEKLKRELEKAEGQLDIILRECQGDDDASLANDYGGTGWEKEVPVATVRWHRNRWKKSNEAAENLAAEVTQYAERKGEAWRVGAGTKIMDVLAAYRERMGR